MEQYNSRQHLQHHIHQIFAMTFHTNTNTPAIGALIIVPIVIAASIAWIAIKISHAGSSVASRCAQEYQHWLHRKRIRYSRSRSFNESLTDLDSLFKHAVPPQTGSKKARHEQAWHPPQQTRAVWTFSNRYQNLRRCELSNVRRLPPIRSRQVTSDEVETV